ncbi:uncharacterized protein BJ171DRAFT_40867 [Polychytrium aggregatum]|uniref:uncharacterized protein n=1 Tax=Polychytrium aggregatum TaxID=110093 RepID=UPI0022FEBAF7|nr:uncharacterized protein BJ171DRAFT_40867 [Polychytrium aggregatum]KAI9206086.1 hypothetical protein BJ171DRAFT_40867 [Polychytrium aggregatum]
MTTPTRKKILVAADDSEHGVRAIEFAFATLANDGDDIVVLNVVNSPTSAFDFMSLVSGTPEANPTISADDFQDVIKEETRKLIKTVQETHPVRVQVLVHCRNGDPRHEILAFADEIEPTFIVVGSHGRSALKTLMLGSVSAYVVSHARYPVLVVRRP